MPELPEVETARRLFETHCLGKTISAVKAVEQGGGPRNGLFDDIIFGEQKSSEEVAEALVGRNIIKTNRKGKQMWFDVSGSGEPKTSISMLMHLGMTGAISVKLPSGKSLSAHYKRFSVDAESQWPPKFCKLELQFDDGTKIAFTDPRRLGRILLRATGEVLTKAPISELGPDPLTGMMPLDAFESRLSSRSLPIKALLLDQSFLAGIGNWIADEVLFLSAIHPETAANALTKEKVKLLHDNIVVVCRTAADCDADSSRFPKHWLFMHRWDKGKGPSKTADGAAIAHITVGGRTSAYVPSVQGTHGLKTPATAGAASAAEGKGKGKAKGSAAKADKAEASTGEPPAAEPKATVAGRKRKAPSSTASAEEAAVVAGETEVQIPAPDPALEKKEKAKAGSKATKKSEAKAKTPAAASGSAAPAAKRPKRA